jgi:hypothetical protein
MWGPNRRIARKRSGCEGLFAALIKHPDEVWEGHGRFLAERRFAGVVGTRVDGVACLRRRRGARGRDRVRPQSSRSSCRPSEDLRDVQSIRGSPALAPTAMGERWKEAGDAQAPAEDALGVHTTRRPPVRDRRQDDVDLGRQRTIVTGVRVAVGDMPRSSTTTCSSTDLRHPDATTPRRRTCSRSPRRSRRRSRSSSS